MAETHKGFGLLFEMGCGKTLTAIMIAGTAYQMGKVEKVLVHVDAADDDDFVHVFLLDVF